MSEPQTLCADSRPRLLDLFCGAGGASRGYHDAGFEVVGVDVKPQPNYPFRFVQGDVMRNLAMMRGHRFGEWIVDTDNGLRLHLGRFDAIHASPPCQRDTEMQSVARNAESHPDLIGPVRELLEATGLPYVIENVEGARKKLIDPIRLCGSMFGLGVLGPEFDWRQLRRHRYFETNWDMGLVPHCAHGGKTVGIYGDHLRWGRRSSLGELSGPDALAAGSKAMGINWMTWHELKEAIPPAYSRIIGGQLLGVVQRAMAAAA